MLQGRDRKGMFTFADVLKGVFFKGILPMETHIVMTRPLVRPGVMEVYRR